MKIKLGGISLAVLTMSLLTACSNDVKLKDAEESSEISFALTAENSSRAWETYSNSNKPSEIRVSASYGAGTRYFYDELYKLNANGVWANVGSSRYWPSSDITLKFHAVNKVQYPNGACTFYMERKDPYIRFENYPRNAKDQIDLLYAYQEASRPANGGNAKLNFRHAMSFVAFKAVNNMGKVTIKIDELRLGYYATRGTFHFPTKPTTGNASDAATVCQWGKSWWELTQGGTTTSAGFGDTDWWTNSCKTNDFIYTALPQPVTLNPGQSSNLTDTETVRDKNSKFAYPFLLMPYKERAWIPAQKDDKDYQIQKPWTGETANSVCGGFLMIKCSIQNISGEGNNALPTEDDAYVLGSKDKTVYFIVPFAYDHKPGKKYVYTIKFGNGGNGFDENANPLIVPVEFNVTVDDFTNAGDININN